MSRWRARALELLPELKKEITGAGSPMALWIDIGFPFQCAYDQTPRNEDFIRRVYAYADWCVAQKQSPKTEPQYDLFSCVAVAFYEHIPRHPAARADMPRWFSRRQIEAGKSIFGYLLSDAKFEQLLALFPRSDASARGRSRRHT